LTGLNRASTTLLNNKRSKLRASITRICRTFKDASKATQEQLLRSLDATLVFAQEEAGTAVCISPSGLLLTCSHCIADDAATALDPSNTHWLIFATGVVVRATCVAWDPKRDLALLQITDSEPLSPPPSASTSPTSSSSNTTFPHATISPASPPLTYPLVCIGHPGSEDLEAPTPGTATGYDVLHVSEGAYYGLSPGQDPQDNSDIGALMHDCWTYWGHSGAPVLDGRGGGLVGLHSSWDDETGMRRGVARVAVISFL
ncbi:trypsin-like serine protease, partial [Karstenula rhodostoma CBS 690.94]